MQKNKTTPLSCTICNSWLKWIKYLNLRSETLKHIGENIGTKLNAHWSQRCFCELDHKSKKMNETT